jgi:hypothetical protein
MSMFSIIVMFSISISISISISVIGSALSEQGASCVPVSNILFCFYFAHQRAVSWPVVQVPRRALSSEGIAAPPHPGSAPRAAPETYPAVKRVCGCPSPGVPVSEYVCAGVPVQVSGCLSPSVQVSESGCRTPDQRPDCGRNIPSRQTALIRR